MATKDQERKALEQIKKIVAGLGEESYIGKAFEGCFEMAEENIDNDFWNSWKEKYSTVMDKSVEKISRLEDENEALRIKCDRIEANMKAESERAATIMGNWKHSLDKAVENGKNLREQEEKNAELQTEIIRLKARLFDMMEAQGA